MWTWQRRCTISQHLLQIQYTPIKILIDICHLSFYIIDSVFMIRHVCHWWNGHTSVRRCSAKLKWHRRIVATAVAQACKVFSSLWQITSGLIEPPRSTRSVPPYSIDNRQCGGRALIHHMPRVDVVVNFASVGQRCDLPIFRSIESPPFRLIAQEFIVTIFATSKASCLSLHEICFGPFVSAVAPSAALFEFHSYSMMHM